MKRFTYSTRTEADLDAITEYYAEHNPEAGIRLLDAITARCRQLATQPRQGRPRGDLGGGIRTVVVRQYVVFFRSSADGIDVMRVLHGAREIAPEMLED